MKTILLLMLVLAPLLTSLLLACTEESTPPVQTGNLSLRFDHVVGEAPLQLNGPPYTTPAGETFTVSQFAYYVSNIRLRRADGTEFAPADRYYLVREDEPDSKHLTLAGVPAGRYTALSFVIGVDSARNCSGAQTGALDPVHGMFWSWNTGYIFLRLEGNSPQSPQPYQKLQLHVGGFKGAANCIRTVAFPLAGDGLRVEPGRQAQAVLGVDVAELFTGPLPIRFAEYSAVHGGPKAVQLADNYADMFVLRSVENQ